jgi:phosphatidate phosphatase APP1
MMAYAVHICSSGSYHHRHAILGTTKAYLAAAAMMISDSCRHDPWKYTASSPSFAPEIVAIFNAYKRWEAMPD